MNKLIYTVLSLYAVTVLTGCGGSESNATTLKVLASNVILRSAIADTSEIDTNVKVLAENVILDNSLTTIEAETVQEAIEELAPVLSEVIVGTWNTRSYNNGAQGDIGKVTFQADGTFTIESGRVTVLDGDGVMNGTWTVVDNDVLKTTIIGDDFDNDPNDIYVRYPIPVLLTSNKIVFMAAMNQSIFEKVR